MPSTLPNSNPLSYLGVVAESPPNLITSTRAPTPSDTRGPNGTIILGTLWLDKTNQTIYALRSSAANVATWVAISTGISDIGTAVLVAGTVTIPNTNVVATDRIFLQRISPLASPAIGNLTYVITPGVDIVVTSLDAVAVLVATDVSSLAFHIIREV